MSERPTITVKAPKAGIDLILNSYMTGGEMIELDAAAIGAGFKNVDSHSGSVNINGEEVYRKRLRKIVDLIVVKAGEDTEKDKIWTTITGLQASDYNIVMKRIDAVAAGISEADAGK